MTAKTTRVTIGKRSVELTLTSEGAFAARWSPDIPKEITKLELHKFMQAREELINEMRLELEAGKHIADAYGRSEWELAT